MYQPDQSYGELQPNIINEELSKAENGLTIEKFVELSHEEQKKILQNIDPPIKKELEDLLKESLPEITSEKIIKKTGFFHGIDNHQAKGHAEIILRDNLPYLLLEDIEISYTGFEQEPELHVYLTSDGDINTGIEVGSFDTTRPYSTYQLFNYHTNNSVKTLEQYVSYFGTSKQDYNIIIIFDKLSNRPIAKATLYQPQSINTWLSSISIPFMKVDEPKLVSDNIQGKTGFFHGIDNHQAKGHAEIILRDNLPYLLLEDIEISYTGFEQEPELHVYLTSDGDINTGIEVGSFQSDPLQLQYRLNGIEIQNFNTVEIVDMHTGKSYASSVLRPTYDIFTIAANYFLQDITVKEPKISTNIIQKKSGYFKNINAQSSKGIVKLYQTSESLLLSLSSFEISYNKGQYINLNSNDIFVTEPDPHVYLTTKDRSNSIYLGKLETNIPTLQYQKISNKNNNLNEYDLLVIFDETTRKTLATSTLDTPWFLETSPFLFLEWLVLFLPKAPLLIVLVLIFPLTFDYFRIIGKIIVISLVTLKNRKRIRKKSFSKPKITIMIPAHNEEAGISESIKSAISVDYPNKEIIVIDDGSTDQTYKIAREFYDKGLIKLVHRDEASGSKATALNYGSNYATGELILCMDGDTKLDIKSLTHLSEYFDDENVVAVSGNVKIFAGDPDINNKPVHNTLTRLQSYEYLIAMELGRRFMTVLNMVLIISGAFGIFRKREFNSIGMYDKDNMTEDFDLTLKIKKSRGRIEFVDDAIAWTYCPNNFRTWIKQRTRWAYGQMQTLRKHGDVLQNRRFGITYSVAIADMWILDICLNFLFVFYLIAITIAISLNLINLEFFVNVIVLVTAVYFIMETMIFLLASSISVQTSKKLIYLAPLMAVFYRPLLRLVVFNAYLRALLQKKITWG